MINDVILCEEVYKGDIYKFPVYTNFDNNN